MGKRIIITGATGFVGANLARRLLRDGHEIHLLVRPNYTPWRISSILSEVHIHKIELANLASLTRRVSKIQPEWVFHLAAYGAYSWQTNLDQMVQTNINGTINLVQACLNSGCEIFVNTGSSSEYGFKDHAPSEKEWLEPNSYYAVTKAAATQFCRYTAQSRDMQIPTLRLYSVFGPYEAPSRLLPNLILRGFQKILPPLVNPDIARDFVYVDDVIEAYLLAVTRPNQETGVVYNVGTGIQTSLREVVEIATRILGINVEPSWGSLPKRHWDTNIWIADNHKIRNELGWQPHYTFEQGFRLMVNWFQENPMIQQFYNHFSQMGS